jgi:phosphonate transport system permease protein
MADAAFSLPPERRAAIERAYGAARRAKQLRTALGAVILVVLALLSASVAEVSLERFVEGMPRLFDYILRLVPSLSWATLGADIADWFWGWERWLRLLFETILIAYVGTISGVLIGVYLSFLAAANLCSVKWLVFGVRRLLEFLRTVPEIVFALIFIVAFGLGPVPGVMAIALHTIGAMGKLFSEVNENASMRPVEGIISTGGSWHAAMLFGVLPQVLPNYISYALLRFEINIRGAAVMGFVGAGGIGQELVTAIRQFHHTDISAILLMIIATVMIVDMLTEKLRFAVIRHGGQ